MILEMHEHDSVEPVVESFLRRLEKDADLAAQLESVRTRRGFIELARENGHALTADDLDDYARRWIERTNWAPRG